jgi:hypothetical protein
MNRRGLITTLIGGAAARPPAPQLKGRYSNRLDRIPRQLDPLLATQQLQQDKHAFVRTQSREQPNLIVQRALQNLHPHTRREPARLR